MMEIICRDVKADACSKGQNTPHRRTWIPCLPIEIHCLVCEVFVTFLNRPYLFCLFLPFLVRVLFAISGRTSPAAS
jgi:hypothetical protein